jgi:hypothetical protein
MQESSANSVPLKTEAVLQTEAVLKTASVCVGG